MADVQIEDGIIRSRSNSISRIRRQPQCWRNIPKYAGRRLHDAALKIGLGVSEGRRQRLAVE